MDAIARREDFLALSHDQQDKIVSLLAHLDRLRLSCRCTMVGGRDFTVTVGVGFSAPKYWADKFDVDLTYPR